MLPGVNVLRCQAQHPMSGDRKYETNGEEIEWLLSSDWQDFHLFILIFIEISLF